MILSGILHTSLGGFTVIRGFKSYVLEDRLAALEQEIKRQLAGLRYE